MQTEKFKKVHEYSSELFSQFAFWKLPSETALALEFCEKVYIWKQLVLPLLNDDKEYQELVINIVDQVEEYQVWKDGYDEDMISPQGEDPDIGDSLFNSISDLERLIWDLESDFIDD